MISEELQKKIDASIRLLQSVAKSYDGIIEVAYSGGKDSDVILQLAKEAGIRYEAIYKNTTIDPPGTIAHVKENGVKIIRPSKTFFHLIAEKGLPNRRMRFCCSCLKEYKIHNKVVIGVRRAESRARSQRYSEPTFTKEEFEVKLRTMIAKETAAFKGATIDVRMSQYGDIIWYTFTKNKADVGCILMKRIKKHITEL